MELTTEQLSELMRPMADTYGLAHRGLPSVETIGSGEIPRPLRQLLEHEDDMTPTLERFHGRKIILKVLQRRLNGSSLLRQVVLVLEDDETPVEFGAIRIYLDRFDEAARREIQHCRRPLGSILEDYHVRHVNRPSAFLKVEPDELIKGAMGLEGGAPLYGRCNTILDMDGEPMAEIVELLPPVNDEEDGRGGEGDGDGDGEGE